MLDTSKLVPKTELGSDSRFWSRKWLVSDGKFASSVCGVVKMLWSRKWLVSDGNFASPVCGV